MTTLIDDNQIIKRLFSEFYGESGTVFLTHKEVALILAGLLYSSEKIKKLCVGLNLKGTDEQFTLHLLTDAVQEGLISKQMFQDLLGKELMKVMYEG